MINVVPQATIHPLSLEKIQKISQVKGWVKPVSFFA